MAERQRSGGRANARPGAAATELPALLRDGAALQAQGRWQGAFGHFQAALAASPGHPAALAGLGTSALALGQVDLGLGWLRMAVAADANDAGIRAAFGRALARAGHLDEAAAELRTALSQRPGADAARDLAAVLVRRGALDEAEHWFATAALQSPGRADLHEALARLQYRRDAMDLAVASHQRAAELDPSLTRRLNIGFVRHRPGLPPKPPASSAASLASESAPGHDALRRVCEDRSLLILDDFLDDPLVYRAQALALDYGVCRDSRQNGGKNGGQDVGPVNFPGAQTAAQDCGAVMQRIADALGRDLKWDSPDQGAFRYSGAADTARCDIHVDSESRRDIYAAILYLSLPEHCTGGTTFWRHRATGWERRPSPEQLAAQGYKSFIDFERRWIPVGRQRPFAALREERAAAWDLVLEVPMRFNRLIVYRSDFFHAIGELFGDRAENARLVQLFYFESIGDSIGDSHDR